MKLKKVIKILKRILIIGILFSFGFYFYLKNYWRNFATEEEITVLIQEIEKAEPLPERFYEIYNVDNPNSLTYSLNQQIFNAILTSNFTKPPSSRIALSSILFSNQNNSSKNYTFGEISLSWKIETKVSQQECLNLIANREKFLYNIKGVKEASEKHFNKNLKELNDKELATLVLMIRNPSLYNPNRRKKILERRLKQLLKKVTMANNV